MPKQILYTKTLLLSQYLYPYSKHITDIGMAQNGVYLTRNEQMSKKLLILFYHFLSRNNYISPFLYIC
jgi:hypothetical protein